MRRIFFPVLFTILCTVLHAQDVSQLERENGFFNIHFYSVITDFRDPKKLENTSGDWYRLLKSPKRTEFGGWAIETEEIHLVKDTVRDITISLVTPDTDGGFKDLIGKCTEKYGKVTRQIETPLTAIYIWESPNISFSILVRRNEDANIKPVVKAIFSSVSR